jgi:PAS domain S-box-containing protein
MNVDLEINFELFPDPILLVNKTTYCIEYFNEATRKYFNDQQENIIGKHFSDWALHIHDLSFNENTSEFLSLGGERLIITGSKFIFVSSNYKLINHNNEAKYIIYLHDITLLKNKIDQHKNSAKEYRDLVENVSDIIYKTDDRGYFIYVNPTASRVTGYSEGELLGKHFIKLIRNDYKESILAYYKKQLQYRERSTYQEFPVISKSGQEIWVGQTVDLSINERKEIYFFSMCRDITDRKKIEKQLLLNEEKYKSILENLELGLLEVDIEGIVIKAYPQFCQLTGYSENEIVGKDANRFLLTPESFELMQEQLKKRAEGKSSVYEVQIIKKNGDPIWVIISGAPYYNDQNELIGTVGIHLDITDRKRMESELIHAKNDAEKLVKSKDEFIVEFYEKSRKAIGEINKNMELLSFHQFNIKENQYIEAILEAVKNLLHIAELQKMEKKKSR